MRLPVSARATPRSMRRAGEFTGHAIDVLHRGTQREVIVAGALRREIGKRRVDLRALAGVEEIAVGRERCSRGVGNLVGLDLRFCRARAPACRRPHARTNP